MQYSIIRACFGKILTRKGQLLKIARFYVDLCSRIKTAIMNFSGILIGAAVFVTIGLFHPFVIKMEYHFGKQSWWVFLLIGLVCSAASLLVAGKTVSILLGVVAFSGFWGIHEMLSQEMRVLRGWFPENPKRHAYYEERRRQLKDVIGPFPSHDHLKGKTRSR